MVSKLPLIVVLAAAAASGRASAQDSVALTPGGNDALSAYDAASQRVRYAVDLSALTTSWGNPIVVGPILKASRDLGTLYRTQVVASVCVSPTLARDRSFPVRQFAVWNTPGAGVHPTLNAGTGSTSTTGFSTQFAVGMADCALAPSNAVGAIVGRESGSFNRLLVERIAAASSRTTPSTPDTCTLSLGAIDALGNLAIRADGLGTIATTVERLHSDTIARVAIDDRGASVNTIGLSGASDPASTIMVLREEPTPTNTPAIVSLPSGTFALCTDFASRFRVGAFESAVSSTISHLPSGIVGHRGNPSFMPITPLGGDAGTIAMIGLATGTSLPNRLFAFGVASGVVGAPPSVAPGSPRAFTLPSPIASGAFVANAAGTAAFKGYLSQTGFRGGNGQVGIGTTQTGLLMLAGVATDPIAGSFIAVVTATTAASQSWSIAGYSGMPVLSGPNGPSIGTLSASGTQFSSPGIDRFGNVYYLATWTPVAGTTTTGLFKAVNVGGLYKLELLLSNGRQIVGANSTRTYTISALTLTDSDSIASAAMSAGSIIQERDPAAIGFTALSIRAFGGVVVSALLTYDNGGTPEPYDAVLYLGPAQGIDCAADFNGVGGVTVQDIFDFLAAWFASDPRADVNGASGVTVQDIFDFLSLWFVGC